MTASRPKGQNVVRVSGVERWRSLVVRIPEQLQDRAADQQERDTLPHVIVVEPAQEAVEQGPPWGQQQVVRLIDDQGERAGCIEQVDDLVPARLPVRRRQQAFQLAAQRAQARLQVGQVPARGIGADEGAPGPVLRQPADHRRLPDAAAPD